MSTKTINYVDEFTDCPGGRYRSQGDFSGEELREDHLVPALRLHDKVIVNLNGALGYASGFLSEAFGEKLRAIVGQSAYEKLEIVLNDDPRAARRIEELTNLKAA